MTPTQQFTALTRVAMFLGVEPQRVQDAMNRAGVVFADDQTARVLQFGRVTDTRPCDVEG